jgi:hypothetical protein
MLPEPSLTTAELRELFRTVFRPRPDDAVLTLIVDVPDAALPDTADWRDRRLLAYDWWTKCIAFKHDLGLDAVELFYYPHVGSNNNDLPAEFHHWGGRPDTLDAARLRDEGLPVSRDEVLARTDLIIALTEFSATAPCKLLAKRHGFRGTTMPGFVPSMIPALRIDYDTVHRRILAFKQRLDAAVEERLVFRAAGRVQTLRVDLRHRSATASSGLFHEDMVVGNLPSGEAYIVPYEGEKQGDDSRTAGTLPVQFGAEIVLYEIAGNRAVAVASQGPESDRERLLLQEEPAYGNIAEIGHGILGDFGCTAVGNLLMDEKLGLHVAFGRSDHFGGALAPSAFHDPRRVIHIDRVYVPSLQPGVEVLEATLAYPDGSEETIMRNGAWQVA